jgi:hypothetical protein
MGPVETFVNTLLSPRNAVPLLEPISSTSGSDPVAGACEYGYELLGSTKNAEFLVVLSDFSLLKGLDKFSYFN